MSAIVLERRLSEPEMPLRLIRQTRDAEPGFFGLAMILLLAMAPTAFAGLIDHRELLGASIWLKPFKFEVALCVYLVSLAFFARFLPPGTTARRWYRVYSPAVMLAIILEMMWIAGAAAIGTASHFNTSLAGQIVYPAMG